MNRVTRSELESLFRGNNAGNIARYIVSISEVRKRWPSDEEEEYTKEKGTHYMVWDMTEFKGDSNASPDDGDNIAEDLLERAVEAIVRNHTEKYNNKTLPIFSADSTLEVAPFDEHLNDLIYRPPTLDELRQLNRAVIDQLYEVVE